MPAFEVLSRHEAIMRSDTGKRSQVIREYVQYIERLAQNQAGRITPSPGETMATIRRRLESAIQATGKNMQIKRTGAEICFGKTTLPRDELDGGARGTPIANRKSP